MGAEKKPKLDVVTVALKNGADLVVDVFSGKRKLEFKQEKYTPDEWAIVCESLLGAELMKDNDPSDIEQFRFPAPNPA